jgi:exodeoxyribonuclease V alpha subunit
MQPETLLRDIESWRQLGWMRATEVQFARFLAGLEPEVSDDVLLAAVLTSHQLGRGHVCLPLAELLAEPLNLLDLPPERPGIDTRVDPDRERKEKRALATLEQHLEALDPGELETRLLASSLVSTGSGTTPLVHDRGHLYLRRTWQAETDIAAAVADRGEWLEPVVGPSDLGRMIREIFAGPQDEPARLDRQEQSDLETSQNDIDWQQVACAVAARSRLAIITGGPGTGKTWTVVRIIALLQRLQALNSHEPLRIRLAAPTGKAAQRLSESINEGWKEMVGQAGPDGLVAPEKAATLHRLLGSQRHTRHFRHDHLNPLPADVVIVDEASMIDQEMMQSLLDALAPTTRLILLGDKDQLASVEAGAVFGDLCQGVERAEYSAEMADWIERVSGADLSARTDQGGFADQRVMLRRNRRSASVINDLAERVNE